MIQKFIRTTLPVVFSSLVIVSCGGASSPSSSTTPDNTVNVAPVLSLSNTSVNEKSVVNIPANATDSDGTIINYQWTQMSGEAITINDSSSDSLSFTAPSVTEAETLTFSLSVTDNDGAVTNKTMDVTIDPIIVASFTVSGVVNSTRVMKDANIIANIGDMQFSTKTNEAGQYTVTINIDDDYQEQVLTIAATWTETNSAKKLVSVVSDVPSLIELANKYDNVITQAELPNLLVSNVSTAVAVLMVQANNNEAISTPEQLLNSSADFNSDILMPYAAMIGYLFDNLTDVPSELLPANFVNTYQAFLDKSAVTQFYYAINQYNSSIFGKAAMTVWDQNNISVSPLAFTKETSFNLDIGRLVLKPDHSGVLYSSKSAGDVVYFNEPPTYIGEKALTWENTEVGIKLTLNEPVLTHNKLLGYKINWLYHGKYRDVVFIRSFNADYIFSETLSNAFKTVESNDLLAFIQEGDDYVFKMNRPNLTQFQNSHSRSVGMKSAARIHINTINSLDLNTTDFNIEDGFSSNIQNAQWNVNDKKQVVINADNIAIELSSSSAKNNQYRDVIAVTTQTLDNKVEKIATVGTIYKVDKSLEWTNENAVGVYVYQSGITALNGNDVNWYELREDGSLSSFWIHDSQTGEIKSENINELQGLWRIIDHRLIVKTYITNFAAVGGEKCQSLLWSPEAYADCSLLEESEWSFVQRPFIYNKKHNIVAEKYKYYGDASRLFYDDNITGHIIEFAFETINDFIKTDTRPVTLPDDYILIKDRTSANGHSLNKAVKKPLLTLSHELTKGLLH